MALNLITGLFAAISAHPGGQGKPFFGEVV
jgi:hypothetical protein